MSGRCWGDGCGRRHRASRPTMLRPSRRCAPCCARSRTKRPAREAGAIPVARLQDAAEGRLRLGSVEKCGIRMVGQVLDAGAYRLLRIPGVGRRTVDCAAPRARRSPCASTWTGPNRGRPRWSSPCPCSWRRARTSGAPSARPTASRGGSCRCRPTRGPPRAACACCRPGGRRGRAPSPPPHRCARWSAVRNRRAPWPGSPGPPPAPPPGAIGGGISGAVSGSLGAAGCGAPHSFTASTDVVMADGSSKPIDQVKVGDKTKDSVPGLKGTQTHTVEKAIVTHTDHDFVDVTIAPTERAAMAAPTTAAKHATSLRGQVLRKAAMGLAASAAVVTTALGFTGHHGHAPGATQAIAAAPAAEVPRLLRLQAPQRPPPHIPSPQPPRHRPMRPTSPHFRHAAERSRRPTTTPSTTRRSPPSSTPTTSTQATSSKPRPAPPASPMSASTTPTRRPTT